MVDWNHYTAESFATNSLSSVDKYTKLLGNKWHKKGNYFTFFGLVMQILLQDMTANVLN